jgi:hypothetical protein
MKVTGQPMLPHPGTIIEISERTVVLAPLVSFAPTATDLSPGKRCAVGRRQRADTVTASLISEATAPSLA